MSKVLSIDVGGILIDFHYADYVWNVTIPQLCARKGGISGKLVIKDLRELDDRLRAG